MIPFSSTSESCCVLSLSVQAWILSSQEDVEAFINMYFYSVNNVLCLCNEIYL